MQTSAASPGQPLRATTVAESLAACQTIGLRFNAVVDILPVDPHTPGMPIAVKDIIDIAGHRATHGSLVAPREPATASAAVIEICAQLGWVPVATTTCQEHSYGILGEESTHGRGINPIWPGWTTGGSSYGSAIAVATGVVPAALGTDTAGSVRVPAACAGVIGFKPTLGRLPTAGIAPLSGSFDTVGLFTRSLAELAALWPPLATACPGPVPGQATVAGLGSGTVPEAGAPSQHRVTGSHRRVRIGVFAAAQPGGQTPHDRTWLTARVRPWLERCAAVAADRGLSVEIVDLDDFADLSAFSEAYSTVRGRESWQIHRHNWEAGRRDYQPQVRANLAHDQTISQADCDQAQDTIDALRSAATEVFAHVDLVLTPTLGCEPVRWDEADQQVRWAFRAYTQVFNVLGWPALSLPIEPLPRLLDTGHGVRAAFPASVQLAAAPWCDTALIDTALAVFGTAPGGAGGTVAGGPIYETGGAVGGPLTQQQSSAEQVVLLADDGAVLGAADKATVHTDRTALHQAFSCFVFDAAGQVLLTRRAVDKKTWPGVWTNALCGHPGAGEPIAAAVHRRAAEELGCKLTDLDTALPAYRYQATDASGIMENEICPVFTARLDGKLDPAPEEVAEYAWIDPADLDAVVTAAPFLFSPWMQEEWQLLRQETAG